MTYNITPAYWEQAEWHNLMESLTDPAKYPEKIAVDHRFFEDCRKRLFVLEHEHAGNYDYSGREWGVHQNPPDQGANPGHKVHARKGTWTVSTWVPNTVHGFENYEETKYLPWNSWTSYSAGAFVSVGLRCYKSLSSYNEDNHPATNPAHWLDLGVLQGRWILWKNTINLTYNMCNDEMDPPFVGPPINIHPEENVWVTRQGCWQMVPNPNYYHDHSYNSAMKSIYSKYGKYVDFVWMDLYKECPPRHYLPQQTDPRRQYRPVIFNDTEDRYFQYKGKFAFDKDFITIPGSLGPVNTQWSRAYIDTGRTHPHFQWRDWYGMILYGSDGAGNQYTNYGGEAENSNLGVADEHTRNPKVCLGLQNRVEMTLSAGWFRYPADGNVSRNFVKRYAPYVSGSKIREGYIRRFYENDIWVLKECTEDDGSPSPGPYPVSWKYRSRDTFDSWSDYPDVNDELWGECEAGFELLKKKTGKYDWFFDRTYEYVPFPLIQEVEKHTFNDSEVSPHFNHVPSATQLKEEWDLVKSEGIFAGTWRPTWSNSLGRPSPFMRSKEMDMIDAPKDEDGNIEEDYVLQPPNYKDSWNPNHDPFEIDGHPGEYCEEGWTGGVIKYDDQWSGELPRTNQMPTLNYFDNKNIGISKTSKYTFRCVGNGAVAPEKWSSLTTYHVGDGVFVQYLAWERKYFVAKTENLNKDPQEYANTWEEVEEPLYLKLGWMVHLCKNTSERIDGDILPAFVLNLKYMEADNETIVTVSEDVGDYSKIAWNTEICERHDGCGASYEITDEVIDYEVAYYPTAELMLEIREVLELAKYKGINLALSKKYGYWHHRNDPDGRANTLVHMKWDDQSIEEGYNFYDDRGNGEVVNGGWYGGEVGVRSTAGTQAYDPGGPIPPYWDGAYNCQAYKATWVPPLKSLPSTILLKVRAEEVYEGWDEVDYGDTPFMVSFSQATVIGGTDLRNRLVPTFPAPPPFPDLEFYYKYAVLATNNKWMVARPSNLFPSQLMTQETGDYIEFTGIANLPFTVNTEKGSLILVVDWENVPESVFQPCPINHIDAPKTLAEDTFPPDPNPPAFHKRPVGRFEYIPLDYYPNDPAKESTQEAVKLWIDMNSCLCQDNEGSDPVKYRSKEEKENGSSSFSEWTTSNKMSKLARTLSISEAFGAVIFSYGTITHDGNTSILPLFHPNIKVGDKVFMSQYVITGKTYLPDPPSPNEHHYKYITIHTVTSIDGAIPTTTITPRWHGETGLQRGVSIGLLDHYEDTDKWNLNEPVKEYKYSIQAKDSAIPINNEGEISDEFKPIEPAKFPGDVLEEYITSGT